jgi:pyruvate dehydrogenase E1 component beta subunit
MISAIKDNNPVLIIDHRFNFKQIGVVPEEMYYVPIGKGLVRKIGRDVTVVAVSHLVVDSFFVSQELARDGVDVELIDPRTLRPLDEEMILESVAKTGRLVIVDCGWRTGGVTSEIAAIVAEKAFRYLKSPIVRVTCPDLPTPAACELEDAFYITKGQIREAILKTVNYKGD